MQPTQIEYLTHSWNPIAMRCTPVSDGCANCWHLRMAPRIAGMHIKTGHVDKKRAYQGGAPYLDKEELAAPLRRKKPAVIGVQFMGDLFHESITDEQIAAVFGVMAATPHHQYCVLTKRVERAACVMSNTTDPALTPIDPKAFIAGVHQPWPLPNVMLGVSVENQEQLKRAWILLKIPAAKWFISLEPLLYEVDLDDYELLIDKRIHQHTIGNYLDWVILGAETGPGKRPMELDWARSVRDQCQAAGTPFFFKQDSQGRRELDGRRWQEMPGGE